MTQEIVAAIGSANLQPAALIERYQSNLHAVDLRTLHDSTDLPIRGGASIQPLVTSEAPAASAMNLQALAGQFSNGLQHGFYANDIDRLMHKMEQSHQPGSGVTFGDVTVELLNVQAKVGIADAFSKVSSKLSEGLQTIVVKQG